LKVRRDQKGKFITGPKKKKNKKGDGCATHLGRKESNTQWSEKDASECEKRIRYKL